MLTIEVEEDWNNAYTDQWLQYSWAYRPASCTYRGEWDLSLYRKSWSILDLSLFFFEHLIFYASLSTK